MKKIIKKIKQFFKDLDEEMMQEEITRMGKKGHFRGFNDIQ